MNSQELQMNYTGYYEWYLSENLEHSTKGEQGQPRSQVLSPTGRLSLSLRRDG